jgi:hypothetical protein
VDLRISGLAEGKSREFVAASGLPAAASAASAHVPRGGVCGVTLSIVIGGCGSVKFEKPPVAKLPQRVQRARAGAMGAQLYLATAACVTWRVGHRHAA